MYDKWNHIDNDNPYCAIYYLLDQKFLTLCAYS